MPTPPEPIVSPPSDDELRDRLASLQTAMARESLDAYVVVDPDNVFYLTNFFNFVHERPFVLIVPCAGSPSFVVPTHEVPHVRARAIGALELVEYFEFPAPTGEQWSDRLRELLAGTARVGVEPSCPLAVLDELPGTRIGSGLVDELRMVKSPYEIGRLAHASGVASAGHAALLDACYPGVPAITLYAEVTRSMTAQMLTDMPRANMLASNFVAVVQPPSLSHDPHNYTDVFVALEEGGPHVTVVACRVNGYGVELERSFFLNYVPDAARRPYEAMMEARQLALDKTLPGESMADVDHAVRDLLTKRGYGDNLLHRTGHGFGVTGHEAPFLAVGYDHEIKPNMVFSIEPGIYLPGIGGFRHSDTVLVTETGNLCLTDAPTALDDLTLTGRPQH
jgi:Xaa-Pro dipeptidase